MGLRCTACGFRSTERALFRQEGPPASRSRSTLCVACKTPERWPKATLSVVVWGGIGLALTACAQIGVDFDTHAYPWLVIAALWASSPLVVAIHELGHALAALLVGRRVYVLSLGAGDRIASWRFGDLEVVLARNLARGFIQAYPVRPPARWRTALYLAGGVVANLGACVATVGLLTAFPPEMSGAGVRCAASALTGFALSNLVTAILAVVPRVMTWGDERLKSDGRSLIDLWRKSYAPPDYAPFHVAFRGHRLMRAGLWREAQEHYAAAIDGMPDQPGLLGCLVHVTAREHGPAAAMACYAERRAAFEAAGGEPSPQYGYAVGNVAWQALRTGDASWLSVADALSQEAVEADASSAVLGAVRAAALMAKGDREAAPAQLTAALRHIEDLVDKAEFCNFVANEARRDGELATAAAFEALEAHLLVKALKPA